jgi:polysaccharide biosynthesis transport protein
LVQQGSDGLNLEQAIRILRRRVPLIVLCVVVVAGAAYGFSKRETKKYTATASLAFSYNPLSEQIAGLQTTSGNLLAQQASNLELVRLGDMASKTATALGHGLTAGAVSRSLAVSGEGESSIVEVSATLTSPVLAADVANTYVRQFVAEQQGSNSRYLKSALAIINGQLAKLSPAQRLGEDGLNLQDRAQTLRLLEGLQYGNVQIAQEALPPESPSSPKTSRNAGLGVLLGLLIGLGLAFVLERLDRRIKSSEDLAEIYRSPLLGVVPDSAALARLARHKDRAGSALPLAESEAFNLIRAHLRFFNVDRDLRTVAIASATPGDGKTTIARHLAEAAARMGSRVLLFEVDLRQPTLAQQLDVQAAPGLTDVVIGAISLEDAVQTIELGTARGESATGRTLDVLMSGTSAPNPGELLESYTMGTVLTRAKATYDLVLIDTPPLAAVSDAFPLLPGVDGVVMVGWVGRSRRDAAERLHEVLASSGAPVLGVVANGAKTGGPSPYGERSSSGAAAPQPAEELARAGEV